MGDGNNSVEAVYGSAMDAIKERGNDSEEEPAMVPYTTAAGELMLYQGMESPPEAVLRPGDTWPA
jgi:hypothetical protein